MSRLEREIGAAKPLDVEPGTPGPGPEELVASGEIDEPVPQGMFLELLGLMAKLKERRQVRGLSLTDVSERSGLTRQAISRLENGWNINPTLETLYRYALSVEAGVTLGLEEVEDDVPSVGEAPEGGRPPGERSASTQGKTIVATFEGGFRDGMRASSASTDPEEVQHALGAFFLTGGGTLGGAYLTVSDAGVAEMLEGGLIEITPDGPRLTREPGFAMDHVYEVVGRVEHADSIRIVLRYRRQVDSQGPPEAGETSPPIGSSN